MALETSIDICVKNACTTIVFKETTGQYNLTTNPTGYGSPNPTTASVTSAILSVISPDNVTYTIDLLDTGNFPSSNTDYEYEIPLVDLGNRTNIEDGYWQFVYTIVTGDEYIATKTAIFHCNTKCCVDKMLLNIDTDCDCNELNDKKIKNYTKAKAFYDALKHYAYCGNLNKFNNIKLIIDKLCKNINCKTCN